MAVLGAIGEDIVWLFRRAAGLVLFVLSFAFFVLAVRLIRSADKALKYEGYGYLTWMAALWAFAIPELYGAFAGHNGRVPTLSNTVGNLLYDHDFLSIVVVGVVVGGVLHAVRVQLPALAAEEETPPASAGQWTIEAQQVPRVTATDDDAKLPVVQRYLPIAAVVVGLAFLLPVVFGASKQVVGESGYGALAVFLFLVPGVMVVRHEKVVPFPSLFTTFIDLEKRCPPLAVVVATGLVFLMIHLILYPFPSIIPDIQGFHEHCDATPKPALCVKP